MNEIQDPRGTWENFDLTDEQVERINNGDVDEFNLFFMRNYEYIKKRCRKILFKYGLANDYIDGINAVYLDLRSVKFKSAIQLEKDIYRACSFYNHVSYLTCRRDCPNFTNNFRLLNVDYGFELNCDRVDADDKSEYFIIDRDGETVPSIPDEIENEFYLAKANNVDKLCQILAPFLAKRELEVLPYYLNGYTEGQIGEALGMRAVTANHTIIRIRDKLILNYKAVVAALLTEGYASAFLQNVVPEKYDDAVRRKESLKRSKAKTLKRWREQNKEKLAEYNRNYVQRRRSERDNRADTS